MLLLVASVIFTLIDLLLWGRLAMSGGGKVVNVDEVMLIWGSRNTMLLAVMGESTSSGGVLTGLNSVEYLRLGLMFSLFAIFISAWSR